MAPRKYTCQDAATFNRSSLVEELYIYYIILFNIFILSHSYISHIYYTKFSSKFGKNKKVFLFCFLFIYVALDLCECFEIFIFADSLLLLNVPYVILHPFYYYYFFFPFFHKLYLWLNIVHSDVVLYTFFIIS